jgi:hypothetical protein
MMSAMAESVSCNKHYYSKGDKVDLFVNSVTSPKNLYPMDYYQFPNNCQTESFYRNHKEKNKETFGELLEGDRIHASPYENIHVLQDVYCQQSCISFLERRQQQGVKDNKMVRAIVNDYHNKIHFG